MIPLPPWANPFLNEQKCPYCKAETHVHGVIGVGVRQKDFSEDNPSKGGYVLTFEYVCPSCSKKSLWIADPSDPEADLVALLEQIISMHSSEEVSDPSSVKSSGSKISNKEIEALKRVLHSSKSYEEFLRYLGIDPEVQNDEPE
tara:strand:+ start:13330 stop:13761 length:432 start_codon:yes stop_codon:yes gene_type:complete